MDTNVNYVAVGLFVIVLGAAILFGTLWLGSGPLTEEPVRYAVVFDDSVSGLAPDALVRYKGVEVGQVVDIAIDPDDPRQVIVVIEVNRSTPVTESTTAELDMQGVTGLVSIDLRPGRLGADPLPTPTSPPYAPIPGEPSLIGRLDDMATELIAQLSTTAERVNALLADENRTNLVGALENLERVSRAMADERQGLPALLADVERSTEQLPALVQQISRSAEALERMGRELSEAGRSVTSQVEAGGGELRQFADEILPETTLLIRELRLSAENLRQMSQELSRDPSVLIYGAPQPKAGPGER